MPRRRNTSRRGGLASAVDASRSPAETPALIRKLAPEALLQLVRERGPEASAELIFAATPAQLTSVFDADLWRPDQAGHDEAFDESRFGEWVEALVEADPEAAAATLARADQVTIVAGLSRYLRVFDAASLEPTAATDDVPMDPVMMAADRWSTEIAGYVVVAKRQNTWDALVQLLVALESKHHDKFHALMRECRRLSNSTPEIDGLDDLLLAPEQLMHDLARARDDRRATLGYVAGADARAFLAVARKRGRTRPVTVQADTRSAGLVKVADIEAASAEQTRQIARFANTLMAGCSFQARLFTAREAADAALATCRLGVEMTTGHAVDAAALVAHDLGHAFEAGWAALHDDVGAFAAGQLIAMLPDVATTDSEIGKGLRGLRRVLVRHQRAGKPWLARDALDVIAILDVPVWAGLLGLLDECPFLPAAVPAILSHSSTAIDATAFEFSATTAQVRRAQEFVARIPELLVP
jgi:hypothetical protein